jgi:O-methyltransferase
VSKTANHKLFRLFGLEVIRLPPQYPPDFLETETQVIDAVGPWTLTSPERIYALIHAVRYVSTNAIPGGIVECGVWKGGSMAAVARTLLEVNDLSRDLYLFDTFAGMTELTSHDVDYSGKPASWVLAEDSGYRCANAPLEEVRALLFSTGYPRDRIHFVQGKVEDTIPGSAPSAIALLRLDTDWYASTKHELEHLFPRLSRGGVLIIDDYGHWRGSRKACDEYFTANQLPILLNRIDYTGRIALKP